MESNAPMKVDAEMWKLYKHLGNSIKIDQLPEKHLAEYLQEIPTLSKVPLPQIQLRIQDLRRFRQALIHLLTLPQVQQRSPEWYELRRNRLTASDLAQAMGRGKFGNRSQLLRKKAFPEDSTFSMNSEPLRWGVMFEPIAARSYTQRMNDVVLYDFGCIPHPDISCFGASPDGISELGIMVEFKCPWRRKIDGNVLEQYEIQMQGQMAVCGLEECHFVECDIQKLENEDEYVSMIDSDSITDHGIVIEYTNADDKFLYSPEYLTTQQALEWMREQPANGKIVYWKLRKYHMCCVPFDKERWESMIPIVVDFWKEVEAMRASQQNKSTNVQSKSNMNSCDFIEDDDDIGF